MGCPRRRLDLPVTDLYTTVNRVHGNTAHRLYHGVRLHGTRVGVISLTPLSKIRRSLGRISQNSKRPNFTKLKNCQLTLRGDHLCRISTKSVKIYGSKVEIRSRAGKECLSLRRISQNSKTINDITWGPPVLNINQIGQDIRQ